MVNHLGIEFEDLKTCLLYTGKKKKKLHPIILIPSYLSEFGWDVQWIQRSTPVHLHQCKHSGTHDFRGEIGWLTITWVLVYHCCCMWIYWNSWIFKTSRIQSSWMVIKSELGEFWRGDPSEMTETCLLVDRAIGSSKLTNYATNWTNMWIISP